MLWNCFHSNICMYTTPQIHQFPVLLSAGSRGVRAIKYNNITGVDVNDLYSSEKYPDQPDEYSLFVNFEPVDISRYSCMYVCRLHLFKTISNVMD